MNSTFRTILVLVFVAVAACAQAAFEYSDVSDPAFFPILTWDPQHGWAKPFKENPKNGLEAIAECNFNMAGFVFPKDLKKCQKLGMGAIILPVDQDDFTNFEYFRNWSKLSDEEVDARIRKVVRAAGSNPAVRGFFIVDEPHVREFPGLAKAVAAVKKYAPRKWAYINLFPDYATLGAGDLSQLGTSSYTEYLERFVNEVHPQALSYDNYMVQYSNDGKDAATVASYYRNLLEVRRVAQKYHLPFLNIVSSNQIRPGTPIPSPENLLLQAYTTVAAGYRGVTWYTFYSRGYHYAPIDNSGNKTLTYEYLKEVNRQVATLAPILSKLESTGVFFSKPAPAPDLPVLPGKLVEAVTSSAGTPVMIGEFGVSPSAQMSRKDDVNGRYVMVVNLSLERTTQVHITTVSPPPSHAGGYKMKVVSAVDRAASDYDTQNGIWLNAGQGVLVKIE